MNWYDNPSVIIAIFGLVLTIAAFFVGRQGAAKTDGKEQGALSTDVKYIKQSVDRIDTALTDNVKRLEGRIDEQSAVAINLGQIVGRADEKAASAHKRLDEHLKREHNIRMEEKI